jgi:hypothetical protein
MYIHDRALSSFQDGLAEPVVKPSLQPWKEFVARALDVLKRQQQIGIRLSSDQTRRLACLLQGTLLPNFDDRFVNFWDLNAFQRWGRGSEPAWDMILQKTTTFLDTSRQPTVDDRFVLRALELMDQAIIRGIKMLDMQYHLEQSAMSSKMVTVKNWIVAQQKKPNNVYSCYRYP